jgi:hypothetical protein
MYGRILQCVGYTDPVRDVYGHLLSSPSRRAGSELVCDSDQTSLCYCNEEQTPLITNDSSAD